MKNSTTMQSNEKNDKINAKNKLVRKKGWGLIRHNKRK